MQTSYSRSRRLGNLSTRAGVWHPINRNSARGQVIGPRVKNPIMMNAAGASPAQLRQLAALHLQYRTAKAPSGLGGLKGFGRLGDTPTAAQLASLASATPAQLAALAAATPAQLAALANATPAQLQQISNATPQQLAYMASLSGATLVGTPDQIQAMVAANMNVPTPTTPVAYDSATISAAVATVNSAMPKVPIQTSISPPSANGVNYTATDPTTNLTSGGTLGSLGAGPSGLQITETVAATTASYIAVAAGIGAFAGPIGAAVGVIVGVIIGLFHHKTVSPPTTAAQIQQARQLIAAYSQIAGTCIGRAFPQSTIQDLTMALCINADASYNNAGGCGNQAGIANSWNEQMVRLNAFFTAMQNAPIGSEIVLRDIPSLPGHGKTNTNVTFSFPNPGVHAPNYILGPYYSQYFFTMCNIFQNEGNCSGWQLQAPMPQYVCDLIDWYRSQHSQWDIPAGTVDPPVDYPTLALQPGQVNEATATASTPVLSAPATGINPNITGASDILTDDAGVITASLTGGAIVASPSNPLAANPVNVLTTGGGGIVSSIESELGGENLWWLIGAAALIFLLYETKPRSTSAVAG